MEKEQPQGGDNIELFAFSATDGLLDAVEPLDIAKVLTKSLYRNDKK